MIDLDLHERLAKAARELADEEGMQATVALATTRACQLVAHCDHAGITVTRADGIETLAATSDLVRRIAEVQDEVAEGPCYTWSRTGDTVTSNDLVGDSRWPRFGVAAAAEIGIRSILALRLFKTKRELGVLSLYSSRAGAFSDEDIVDASALATHTAIAIASERRELQLTDAMHSRTVIGQAMGILMERYDLDADRAFAVLQRASSEAEIKLYEVAAKLVATRLLPGD